MKIMSYKGKLVKVNNEYHLWVDHMVPKITPFAKYPWDITKQRLSLKNCQAIERGYDLDELIDEAFDNMGHHSTVTIHEEDQFKLGYKLGFQKALEVKADKRFTIKDMVDCWNKALSFQDHKETLGEHIQSLKQTEWDVEIVQELVFDGYEIVNTNPKVKGSGNKIPKYDTKPKLDADGCLILKCI
jgi:hypothetical protein